MDKEQDPIKQAVSDTPELQETLENEEINIKEAKVEETSESNNSEAPAEASEESIETEPSEAEGESAEGSDEAEESNESEEAAESEADDAPRGTLFDAPASVPEDKKDKRMLIAVIILSAVVLIGLIVGAIILFSGKGSKTNNSKNEATGLIDDAKIEEEKEKIEKELEEKEEQEKKKEEAEKERKEQEEKDKKAKEEQEAKEKEQAKEKLRTTLSADGVLSNIADKLEELITVDDVKFAVEKGAGAIYQPAEYKTHIYLGGSVINVEGSENLAAKGIASSEIQSSINENLADLGFEKVESVENPFFFVSNLTIFLNGATNVVCTSYASFEPALGCAVSTNYRLSERSIVNSLAEAYNKVEGRYPLVVSSNDPEREAAISDSIMDTGYKKYQTLTPFIGQNAMSLFYRESPSSDWVYLLSTQAAIDCSIYSNDLQKGLGQYCQN